MKFQRLVCLAGMLAACAAGLPAQTQVRLKGQSQDLDMSNAPMTRPNRVGSALPAACLDAETFFLLTAPAGQNLHGCVGGIWKVMGDGAGGGVYAATFTAETVKTLTAQQHGLASANLSASCYNTAGDRVEGFGLRVNPSTLQADVSFPVPFSGTCVLIGSGAGTSGGGDGAPSGVAGGDLSGAYPNPVLVPSGVTAGTYGGATQIPQIQVDAKGRVVAVTPVSISGGGSGSVTSVGLGLPTEFTVSGSPVTGSGSLTAAWAPQTAAKVLASPSGSSGTPAFRPLAQGDLPVMSGDSGSGGAKGAVPAPSAGDASGGKFLKADGTWAVPLGGTAAAGGSTGQVQFNMNSSLTGRTIGAGLIDDGTYLRADEATVPTYLTAAQSVNITVPANGFVETLIPLPGAATGDSVSTGVPPTIDTNLIWNAYVAATDTVVFRFRNFGGSPVSLTGITVRAWVNKVF